MKISLSKVSNTFKLTMVVVTALALILLITKPAHAQEITPAAGTYSYGSTSEFSPYVTLAASTTLAPTGADQNVGFIATAVLVLSASGILAYIITNRRQINKIA